MKEFSDLPENMRNVLEALPAKGDTRRLNRVFRAGHRFNFTDHKRLYKLTEDVTMDVTETYSTNTYGDTDWHITAYHTETSKPVNPAVNPAVNPEPTKWQRFKRWMGFSLIPTARVVK